MMMVDELGSIVAGHWGRVANADTVNLLAKKKLH